MGHTIYCYKDKQGKVVYVGQTKNIKDRHRQHIKYDPYHENAKEYNYPLSRGIRKYGEEYYTLEILEDNILTDNEADEREKYWIKFYDTYWNGYNQTMGGNVHGRREQYTEEQINEVITLLRDTTFTIEEIAEKTGMSITHIHQINYGKRRALSEITYPIRNPNYKGYMGIRFSQDEAKEIALLIKNSKISFRKICKKYNCTMKTLRKINEGKYPYNFKDFSYPIRKHSYNIRTIPLDFVKNIHQDLLNPSLPIEEIAERYYTTKNTVKKINAGEIKLPEYSYPIRKPAYCLHKISPEQNKEIHLLIRDTNESFKKIGERYNVSETTISYINKGSDEYYHLPNWVYPIRKT